MCSGGVLCTIAEVNSFLYLKMCSGGARPKILAGVETEGHLPLSWHHRHRRCLRAQDAASSPVVATASLRLPAFCFENRFVCLPHCIIGGWAYCIVLSNNQSVGLGPGQPNDKTNIPAHQNVNRNTNDPFHLLRATLLSFSRSTRRCRRTWSGRRGKKRVSSSVRATG